MRKTILAVAIAATIGMAFTTVVKADDKGTPYPILTPAQQKNAEYVRPHIKNDTKYVVTVAGQKYWDPDPTVYSRIIRQEICDYAW